MELALRYVVEPKQRRVAVNFIFERVFERVQKRSDITIASSTLDVSVHGQDNQPLFQAGPEQKAA